MLLVIVYVGNERQQAPIKGRIDHGCEKSAKENGRKEAVDHARCIKRTSE
jgi:hypothetical protein